MSEDPAEYRRRYDDTPITNAIRLQEKIKELEIARAKIFSCAEEKAMAMSKYDKELCLNTLRIKEGLITEFEGVKINNPPATLIPLIAKGITYAECYKKELTEANYKGLISFIDAIKAELNGIQSLNKHLE